jgi:hypothetical protein
LHEVPIHFTLVGKTFSNEDFTILIRVADDSSSPAAFTLYFVRSYAISPENHLKVLGILV